MASTKEADVKSPSNYEKKEYYPHIVIHRGSEAYDLFKDIEVGTVLDLFARAKVCAKSEYAEDNSSMNYVEFEVMSLDVAMSYDKDFGESY